jgi:hypothetical protein
MVQTSVRRVPAEKFESAVEDAKVEGWELQTKGDRVATLVKYGGWGSAMGHLIVAVLTIWWTVGIGNLLYAIYRHYGGKQELQIKVEGAV